eukprot:gene1312-1656_t
MSNEKDVKPEDVSSENNNNNNTEKEEKKELPLVEEKINIKVKGQNSEVQFKVRTTTPFLKLMNAYCEKTGLELKNLRFLFNGERVNPELTPKHYDMENDDIIDCLIQQEGGY